MSNNILRFPAKKSKFGLVKPRIIRRSGFWRLKDLEGRFNTLDVVACEYCLMMNLIDNGDYKRAKRALSELQSMRAFAKGRAY